MEGFTEYKLARAGLPDVALVLLIRPDGASLSWTPWPASRPTGRMQWWRRDAGSDEWVEEGEVFEY